MMRCQYLLLLVFFVLGGCLSSERPVAQLKFSSFHESEAGYVIIFHSDKNIDALFAEDRGEKIVSRSLTCSLDADRDFRVEHSLAKFFDGDVVFQAKDSEKSFRYVSNGDFFASPDGGTQRHIIESKDILKLVANKPTIDCKVVMTVYLSKPYYSGTMKIPVPAVAKVLENAASPLPCCKAPPTAGSE